VATEETGGADDEDLHATCTALLDKGRGGAYDGKSMREKVAFLAPLHKKTSRDYLGRVSRADKAECAEVARRFGVEYWDGDRKYGYGGYTYDGRWAPVAEAIVGHYRLRPGSRVLDVGCGKGFLLHEMRRLVPGLEVVGIDVSTYALEHAKEEVRPLLREARAEALPFDDGAFDLVVSLMTLHNLYVFDLALALAEMQRVTKKDGYLAVESYRNEREKANLLAWQLTCESFYTPDEWVWIFDCFGYAGDYEMVYFE
jgi:SAM-dependent methyltransferase